MSKVQISAADFDPNAPLVLEFNEITSFMAISTVGIITVMVLSIYVAGLAFFGKSSQESSSKRQKG
jgi:hypothetical protein